MADEPYTVYCDDYEAITGKKPVVQQKVVTKSKDDEEPEPESTDEAETK